MKETAVEWLIEQLTPSISLQQKHIDEYKKQAKEMEKQQGYNEDDINIMFDTLKENSIDNKVTITNVDLFISSWKKQFKNK